MPVNLPPPEDLAPAPPPVLIPGGGTPSPSTPPVLVAPVTPPAVEAPPVNIPEMPSLPPQPSFYARTNASNIEGFENEWREILSVPNFGPTDDPNLRDLFRAVQGLSVDAPLLIASGHIDDTSPGERPVLGISRDGGLTFTSIPVSYVPPSGDGVRDPSWIYHRGKFWMAYTAGSFGACAYFGIAVSDGTINADGKLVFTHHINVVTDAGVGEHTWAPEWFIHEGTVGITFSRDNGGVWTLHYVTATNEALSMWTAQAALGGAPNNVIDSQIIRWDGAWLLACRNYSGNGTIIYRSTTSPWTGYSSYSLVVTDRTQEGQCLVNLGGGKMRLYFIDTPGGTPNQAFADSLDGGLTFGDVTATLGDFIVPHMTVRSFLDPQQEFSSTVQKAKVFNLVAEPGATTPFEFLPADFGWGGPPYRGVRMTFVWQGSRCYYEFICNLRPELGNVWNNGTATALHSLTDGAVSVAIPAWTDAAPIIVNLTSAAGTPETVKMTFEFL